MKTLSAQQTTTVTPSKAAFRTGQVISIICIIFLLFDAVMKIIKERHSMEGSVQLGWPAGAVQGIGIVLLVCTILYSIPRTSVLGAILITGYLGGAIAIMIRSGQPMYFPLVFGVLVWGGLFLRDQQVRALIPMKK